MRFLSTIIFIGSAFIVSCTPSVVVVPDHESVAAYYRSVAADNPVSIRELRRQFSGQAAVRSGADVIVEPIGWTVSGKPFADVISGRLDFETRALEGRRSYRSPRQRVGRVPRTGRIVVEIVRIHYADTGLPVRRAWDLPEYFEFIGQPRVGFASIEDDRIFLDMRTETDPRIFDEAIIHEFQHLVDRPIYALVAPEDLEIRAMLRGLADGDIARINLDRLYYADQHGDPEYRSAARRLLAALSLVIVGVDDSSDLRARSDSEIKAAARVLMIVAGI